MNTLLTELDGLDERKNVFVIAATNRPDMIDPAMCRPGRLDKLLYVDLPTADERSEIIRTVTRNVPLCDDTARKAVEMLVRERCDGFSGADLSALVREAGVIALRRVLGTFHTDVADEGTDINMINIIVDDFVNALEKLGPSVSPAQRRKYASIRNKFAGLTLRYAKGVDVEDTPGGQEKT